MRSKCFRSQGVPLLRTERRVPAFFPSTIRSHHERREPRTDRSERGNHGELPLPDQRRSAMVPRSVARISKGKGMDFQADRRAWVLCSRGGAAFQKAVRKYGEKIRPIIFFPSRILVSKRVLLLT